MVRICRNRHRMGLALAALVLLASTSGMAQEVWVVNEGTNNIAIIDTVTDAVSFVAFSDLDMDGTVESPTDICFSTLTSEPGTKAFITRGRFLEIWDVATRTPSTGGPIDVGAALGGEVSACDVAFPREFMDVAGGPQLRSYLYLGLNQGGNANYVVFDQQGLLTAPATAEVSRGLLMSGAAVSSVAVLGLPEGTQMQRVWFGVSTPTMAGGVKITTDDMGLAWAIAEQNMQPAMGGGLFDGMDVHYSGCRELAVLGYQADTTLENLELGLQCSIPGEPGGIEVTGPAPGANTVFVTDRTNNQLHILDPTSCSAIESIPVGTDPVDVVTLGRFVWQRAYVANRGSDTISYVDEDGDGTAVTIFLSPMESGQEGNCFNCPKALGVTNGPACDYKDLMLEKVDTDEDGTDDDIRITYSAPSPSCELMQARVFCGCMTEACACECLGPNCVAPGRANLNQQIGDTLLSPDFPVPIDESAWIDLGNTLSPYTHPNVGNPGDGSQAYVVGAPD